MHSDDALENPYSAPQSEDSPDVVTRGQYLHPSERVHGPAIGIIVFSVIGIVFGALGLLMNILFGAAGTIGAVEFGSGSEDIGVMLVQTILGVFQSLSGLIVGAVSLVGAQRMRKLENYQFAYVSSILIMVPCVSPCCFLGLPLGIWSLTVLSDPFVKSAFQS